jgi:toxin CptA
MRNAPSVQYPVGRCRFYAVLLVGLGLLALAVLLAWWWPLLRTGVEGPLAVGRTERVAGVLGVLFWLGWAVGAALSWRRSPIGVLQWDALASPDEQAEKPGLWRWRSAAYQGGTSLLQVSVALDLQSRLLLRLRNNDAAQSWIWVEASSVPGRWSDLRRALVATRA